MQSRWTRSRRGRDGDLEPATTPATATKNSRGGIDYSRWEHLSCYSEEEEEGEEEEEEEEIDYYLDGEAYWCDELDGEEEKKMMMMMMKRNKTIM